MLTPSKTPTPTTPVALMDPEDGPKWVEILRTGVHRSRFVDGASASGHSEAVFTKEDLESACRGFAIAQAEQFFPEDGAPVGYNHAEFAAALKMVTGEKPDEGDLFSAAAQYDAVRVEPNDAGGYSLMARHNYTEDGRKRVRAKAFRGYSIDIAPPGSMQRRDGTAIPEWVPFGGTLTNTSFVRGMGAVAASEAAPPLTKTNHRENPMSDALNRILGLSDDAPADKRITEIIALKERAAKADDLEGKVSALTESVSTLTAKRDELTAEVNALTERETKRIGDDAVAAGRVPRADLPKYMKAFHALGEEHANEVYPASIVPLVPAVLTDEPREKTPADADKVWAEVRALTDSIVERDHSSRADAYVAACNQIAKDPAKAAVIHPTTIAAEA